MTEFPEWFWNQIQTEYRLTDKQLAALVAMCRHGGIAWLAAEEVGPGVTQGAIRARMTGVYQKFRMVTQGPGQFERLEDILIEKYRNRDGIQALRSQLAPDIQRRCGMMKVLDMERPIEIEAIFTEVNILERLTANGSPTKLLEAIRDRDKLAFDRFGVTTIQQERVPGIQVVERERALIIFGKPGAGKTTFLKYLAITCASGKSMSDRIPIFVTLKEFSEASGNPRLEEFIASQWFDSGVNLNAEEVAKYLHSGKSLLLLDGLDEVQLYDQRHVVNEIQRLSGLPGSAKIVVTCRNAAIEYKFEHFVEVEMADFGNKEVRSFVTNWFVAKDDIQRSELLIQTIENDSSLKELASSPLLLTLLCLIFEEEGNLPPNRSELYQEGIHLLLKKWDGTRMIRRDEIYKSLSPHRREDLLGYLALSTFETGSYLFEQWVAEEKIENYIENLSGSPSELESESRGEFILKAIEVQHGLLVNQAKKIYSFSHLTFHEYFTAKEIAEKRDWKLLCSHMDQKNWREVVLLTVGILRNADSLILYMKKYIDEIIASDYDLQTVLGWGMKKTNSLAISKNKAAVRAYYLALSKTFDLSWKPDQKAAINLDQQKILNPDLQKAVDLNHALTLALELNFFQCLDLDLVLVLDLDLSLAMVVERSLLIADVIDKESSLLSSLKLMRSLIISLDRAHARALNLNEEKLLRIIEALDYVVQPIKQLKNAQLQEEWWSMNALQWWQLKKSEVFEKLQCLSWERTIGCDWKLTSEQKQSFQRYYDANLLLIECLNSDCYISQQVRQEVEETILLPVSEIQRREQV